MKNIKTNWKQRSTKGFTLIELIVVIVIIGILAAIVVPRFSSFNRVAQEKADISMGKTIATAALTLYKSKDIQAASGEELYNEGYLNENPIPQTDKTKDFVIDWTDNKITVKLGTEIDAIEVYPNNGFED